jgi:hypothetical protein
VAIRLENDEVLGRTGSRLGQVSSVGTQPNGGELSHVGAVDVHPEHGSIKGDVAAALEDQEAASGENLA